ncbi:hypothetical protein [Mesorhizobium sp.]|uniref:hypothetical protein n=1 Tax=Mesorhizobium sp. TaxID=1871066 RepID=UPI0025D17E73|nr:hypothetical protein [Mesorhizobium sp.]
MVDGQASGPEPTPGGAPEIESAARKSSRLISGLKKLSITIVTFLVFGLPISLAIEHLASKEALAAALGFQEDFYDAVENINPLSLFAYLHDAHEWAFFKIDDTLGFVLPLFALNKIMYFVYMLLWIVFVGLSPIIIPISAFFEASTFEFILIVIVLIPLFCVMYMGNNTGGGPGPLGALIGLAITALFYWLLKMAMLGSAVIFGDALSLASGWCGTCTLGGFLYACFSKTTEHSLMEGAMHAGKKAAGQLGKRLMG